MVHRRALASHRPGLLSASPDRLADWLGHALGATPRRLDDYARALTHGSTGSENYQRLEFLGDRVLGLVVAHWLYQAFPADSEGALAKRFATLVSGATCAQVAAAIGVADHLRLGKQARDDGAAASPHVLGDVTEALIGALYLDHGFDAADTFVRRHWAMFVAGDAVAPGHPKSALQEWAAAHNRRAPDYVLTERSGPEHAPRFTVTVSLGSAGDATGSGRSKQEAETAAAAALLEQLS